MKINKKIKFCFFIAVLSTFNRPDLTVKCMVMTNGFLAMPGNYEKGHIPGDVSLILLLEFYLWSFPFSCGKFIIFGL